MNERGRKYDAYFWYGCLCKVIAEFPLLTGTLPIDCDWSWGAPGSDNKLGWQREWALPKVVWPRRLKAWTSPWPYRNKGCRRLRISQGGLSATLNSRFQVRWGRRMILMVKQIFPVSQWASIKCSSIRTSFALHFLQPIFLVLWSTSP